MKKCGFVAVLGEINAGKSTLVNRLVGKKVSIVSRKIQTTMSRILGIATMQESQIILIDTPGFLKDKHAENLEKIAWNAFRESEEVLFIVDACKRNFDTSVALLKKIHTEKKVSLVLNKIDLINKPKLLEIAEKFSQIRIFENIFMISCITGSGIDKVLNYLKFAVPDSEWLFKSDEITNLSFEEYVSEITREQIYNQLHQEVPYKCRVETKNFENQTKRSVKIFQNVYVKNDAHKIIFLGHKGKKIKSIGKSAREELSFLLNKKVHLFLNVLVGSDKKILEQQNCSGRKLV